MSNVIDATGLQVNTREEWVTYFTDGMKEIYGNDINLASDTPDGQMMNLYIQALLDLSDLLVQIYNTFDPDNAIGVILDQRVAINGIQRQAGTYTVTPVTIVTSMALNLYGLDQDLELPYTVADNAGNEFVLLETESISGAGSYVLNFRAAVPGAVLTVPNTITVPVTIVLGVVSINNPSVATSTGENEESDGVLKVRRQRSVSLASQGYYAGLLAALENINGVTSAFVYENVTDSTDSDDIPGHSIWVVVAGTGDAGDIAQAIYTKRNAGCGMKGDESYDITQVDGTTFTVYWSNVTSENLFIIFTATSIDGTTPPNVATIREELPELFVPAVSEEVNINAMATQVQAIDPNTLVTNAGFTDGRLQTFDLSGVAASGTFKVKYNDNESADINWDDAIGTIQSKVQAVTGLDTCLVTGSIASQQLVFDLEDVETVHTLLTITSNSLETGASAEITFTPDFGETPTLETATKAKQFAVTSANIYITPIVISPSSDFVQATESQTFTAAGGYGTLTYSITVNNSGATIDASTGEYTAGSTDGVEDTIQVSDEYGNTATAVVTVT